MSMPVMDVRHMGVRMYDHLMIVLMGMRSIGYIMSMPVMDVLMIVTMGVRGHNMFMGVLVRFPEHEDQTNGHQRQRYQESPRRQFPEDHQ